MLAKSLPAFAISCALPTQRTAGDEGEEYNVDRGNQTDVLAKEKILHHFLDQKDLR